MFTTLSKNKIKYIRSLKEKKRRDEHKTFIAEGNKLVSELLQCMKCQLLLANEEFVDSLTIDLRDIEEIVIVNDEELSKASLLKNPQQSLGIFFQPECNLNLGDIKSKLSIALDGIQDPGNMGTIVRLADWYGIENIFCSKDTVDIYNPKTIQATMGAIARVKVHYLDLESFIKSNIDIPIYGTFLDGKNMYEDNMSDNGIIVMGNEGNGIRDGLKKLISHKLYIPNYPADRETSESLNVAIATAIICAEFRRKHF